MQLTSVLPCHKFLASWTCSPDCYYCSPIVCQVLLICTWQDTGVWELSSREHGPSVRALHGLYWNNQWRATKVLYARFPDGKRKACLVFW